MEEEKLKKEIQNVKQCSAYQLFTAQSTATGEELDRSASFRLNRKDQFAVKSQTRLQSVFLNIKISVLRFSELC